MKYGFIGCGNMGGAIARALSKTTTDILLTSKTAQTAASLAEELGCSWCDSNEDLACRCNVIFLAVKPQRMAGVLTPLASFLQSSKPLLVSMAAGLTTAQIEALAGGNLPVVRIMPNTPVSIGQGMTTYCSNSLVSNGQLQRLLSDLSFAGKFDAIDERLMDAATVAAGCTPAYAYMFIDAIADGAVACGLPRAKALEYAASAVSGAAQLVLQSGQHPAALKDAVCSPGGSTIAGVKALEDNGLRGAVIDAICAAYNRNKELGK